jgi:hypothetical protein
MKKMLVAGLLTIGVTTALFSSEPIAVGKSHSNLGDYKIELADKPVLINGEEFKAFKISYKDSPMVVTVVIRKDKKCKNYIVLSDKLSVQYICNGEYFGIQKLDKSVEYVSYHPTYENLNQSEYFHQKLILPGKRDEVDNTQLIAVYFPRLINGVSHNIE